MNQSCAITSKCAPTPGMMAKLPSMPKLTWWQRFDLSASSGRHVAATCPVGVRPANVTWPGHQQREPIGNGRFRHVFHPANGAVRPCAAQHSSAYRVLPYCVAQRFGEAHCATGRRNPRQRDVRQRCAGRIGCLERDVGTGRTGARQQRRSNHSGR